MKGKKQRGWLQGKRKWRRTAATMMIEEQQVVGRKKKIRQKRKAIRTRVKEKSEKKEGKI